MTWSLPGETWLPGACKTCAVKMSLRIGKAEGRRAVWLARRIARRAGRRMPHPARIQRLMERGKLGGVFVRQMLETSTLTELLNGKKP